MNKWNYFVAAVAVMFGVFVSGCGSENGRVQEDKVLARINKYELMASDFKDEADHTFSNRYLPGGPLKAKEVLLEDIITKKLLLQEAQTENFDKDAMFLKEIERYWEQTLLKLLVKKKMVEFSRGVTVSDTEIREEYDRMSKEQATTRSFKDAAPEIKQDIFDRKVQADFNGWIEGLRGSASVEVNEDVLKNIKIFK